MPSRLRKQRRQRGSRTHGWGQVGQHRKTGMQGGAGKAGLMKSKWTWTVKYDPDHFGVPGFKPPQQRKIAKWINVGQLDSLDVSTNKVKDNKSSSEAKTSLNLTELGYDKLLGCGIVKSAYVIQVKLYTVSAKEKIEKVGGNIV